ncbi:MAG TPA: hypothetical protein VD866_20165 [Urbifossiella sp.]|nr:hypothetical protein [Urbifossiella sp.]
MVVAIALVVAGIAWVVGGEMDKRLPRRLKALEERNAHLKQRVQLRLAAEAE